MHFIWPRHWVHNSDSNYASLPISEMVTSHRGDTLVWQGLKYRQCPTPIAQSMAGNEAWPNISSHLHTQHPSSSACSGAVNNLCISITLGTWVANTELYQVPAGRHATDIFLAERAARHLFFSIAGNLWAIWPSIHFRSFLHSPQNGVGVHTGHETNKPLSSAHHMRHSSKLYSQGCIHEWIRLSFGTQTLDLRMIKGPGEKCWPIFLFCGLQTIIWGQNLFQTDQHQYWGW